MNKIELLKKIYLLYGSNCSAEITNVNLEAYSKLTKGNINYDKLYELIIGKWKYGNYMPTPGFVQEQVSESIIKSIKKKEKNYRYDCRMLENFEKFRIRKGEIGTGYRDEIISLHNNGVKFRVYNVSLI